MSSGDFVVVNKKNCKLKLQQIYLPLPIVGTFHGDKEIVEVICDPVFVEKDGETIIPDSVDYDECYERLLVVTTVDTPLEDCLSHSLVGFPNDEKIFIVPTSGAPYMDLIPEPSYQFHLMLSGADNSHEALHLIHEQEDEDLLNLTKELKDIYETHCTAEEALVVSESPFAAPPPDDFVSRLPPPHTTVAEPEIEVPKSIFASQEPFASLKEHFTKATKPTEDVEIPIRIRRGIEDGLHEKEALARSVRLAHISKTLGPNPPHIALSTSGGGMRAMLTSTGFFSAMKEIGVLDVTLYQCALSGSTWSTSKWMNTKENPFVDYEGQYGVDSWSGDVPFESLKAPNLDKVLKIATRKVFDWDTFKRYLPLLIKSRSFLLVYSQMLGEKMQETGTNYQEWQDKTLSGKYPIAVCTSVFKQDDKKVPFPVVDQTPFEIGSTFLNTYFGVEHYQLENFKHSSPASLNNFMAVWGSAFYANLSQIITDLPSVIAMKIGNLSADGAKVVNVNYNRKDPLTGALLPLANQRYLYYRDGGVLANIPIAPMLRPERTVEMIICMDCSRSVSEKPFGELIKAIPSIQSVIPKNPTYPCVFQKTADYPTIIYIPVIKDPTFGKFDPAECGTFEFAYSEDEARKLIELVRHLVIKSKDVIWNVINSLRDEKSRSGIAPESVQPSHDNAHNNHVAAPASNQTTQITQGFTKSAPQNPTSKVPPAPTPTKSVPPKPIYKATITKPTKATPPVTKPAPKVAAKKPSPPAPKKAPAKPQPSSAKAKPVATQPLPISTEPPGATTSPNNDSAQPLSEPAQPKPSPAKPSISKATAKSPPSSKPLASSKIAAKPSPSSSKTSPSSSRPTSLSPSKSRPSPSPVPTRSSPSPKPLPPRSSIGKSSPKPSPAKQISSKPSATKQPDSTDEGKRKDIATETKPEEAIKAEVAQPELTGDKTEGTQKESNPSSEEVPANSTAGEMQTEINGGKEESAPPKSTVDQGEVVQSPPGDKIELPQEAPSSAENVQEATVDTLKSVQTEPSGETAQEAPSEAETTANTLKSAQTEPNGETAQVTPLATAESTLEHPSSADNAEIAHTEPPIVDEPSVDKGNVQIAPNSQQELLGA